VLDTTDWTTCRRLLPEVDQAVREDNPSALPPGWSFRDGKTSRSGSFFSTRRITLDHEPTGLHAHGTPGRIEGWSVSLPRVLHGCNGIQLKDDIEISASRARVNALLGEISQPTEVSETLRRLDVAINLSFPNPEAVLRTLRLRRHLWIRRETAEYATGNIRFPGAGVVFQAYWKKPPVKTGARQKRCHTPNVLRLEIQLKKIHKIAKFLDLDSAEPLRELPKRRDLYESFRRFMLGFQRCAYRSDKCSMAALLALCMSQDVHLPGGESVMDWHRISVGESAHGKMRRVVAGITSRFLSVDWAELLPSHTIPATVDVFPDGTTKVVPPVPLTRTWSTPPIDQLRDWMRASAAAGVDLGD
jgi:hypothetical protein